MKITERKEIINLFDGLENLVLFHISDIHLRYSIVVLNQLEYLIEVNNPDLIILTGDYYDIPRGAYHFREFLYKTSLQHTILYIKGNHDNIYGTKISNLLLDIPNCYCVEDVVYKYQSKRGYLYNITSWDNKFNLIDKSDEKNIILIHNPEKINESELSNIHVVLAGHLHGGQFIFYKTKNNNNFPGSVLYKYCTDRKQINGTVLIVSKGLGDTFPFRLNCPKEIINIEIR